jgi:hypothetical protein
MSEPRTDIQTVDLLDALVERNIYSSGDLLLYVKQREAEASRIDVERLARALEEVGSIQGHFENGPADEYGIPSLVGVTDWDKTAAAIAKAYAVEP